MQDFSGTVSDFLCMTVANLQSRVACRLFGISCPEVSERLVGQIQAWQIKESCLDEGESCSYEVRLEMVFISVTERLNLTEPGVRCSLCPPLRT